MKTSVHSLPTRRLFWYVPVLVIAAIATWFGLSMTVVVLIALAPVYIVLRSTRSVPVSVALLSLFALWGIVFAFIVARYTGIPPLLIVLPVLVVAGVWAIIVVRPGGLRSRLADLPALGLMSAGALLWAATLVVASILPSGSPVSWAMGGDAANNILFARRMDEDGGISLGGGENPVPLTAALIAFFTLPARAQGAATAAGEILGLVEMWSWGIMLACVLSGALASALVRVAGRLRFAASAVASILPLLWVVSSGPVSLGFLNFHLTIAVVLAALILITDRDTGRLLTFVGATTSVALALVLWSPVVGIPGIVWLIITVRSLRARPSVTPANVIWIIVALSQPVLVGVTLSVPSLLASSDVLAGAGGAVFTIPRPLLVATAVFAVVVAVVLSRVQRAPESVLIVGAAVFGGGVCLAMLLWLRRNEENRWAYYQLKYAWLLLAILLIIAAIVGLALAVALAGRTLVALAVTLATALFVLAIDGAARVLTPEARLDLYSLTDPIPRILAGSVGVDGAGDRIFHAVADALDAQERTVLWATGDPDEANIMFWILQLSARDIDDEELRLLAYYHDVSKIENLCYIRERLGPQVRVITASEDVVTAVAKQCPDLGPVELRR